jgi:transcriptional regulator with XRE-family HTH domain
MKKEKDNKEDTIEYQRLMRIANKIKELRIQKGYSSHETFAWDNNLNRVQYWRVEKGSNLTLKTLFMILDIHHISLSDFFKDMDSDI